MEGNFQLKAKRKGIEDFTDDFSDFSLASPATKIRRLDVGLLPIIEEEEPESAVMLDQTQLLEQNLGGNQSGGLKIEELPNVQQNEERAIVLYNPFSNAPPLQSPSSFSFDPRLFSQLKNQVLRPSYWKTDDDEVAMEGGGSVSDNGCQAVVPWVPPRFPSVNGAVFASQIDDGGEMMEAEEMGEAATMEVEDSRNGNEGGVGMPSSEGLHQWQQQQHCMIPQPPQNIATPIFWYR